MLVLITLGLVLVNGALVIRLWRDKRRIRRQAIKEQLGTNSVQARPYRRRD